MKFIETFEKFVDKDVINILNNLHSTKVKCYNWEVQEEIIKYVSEIQQGESYFIRETKTPIKDLEVGFSACFLNQQPYSDSLEEALSLMSNEKTEDANHVVRFLSWKEGTDYENSNLYKHQLHKRVPGNCLPIWDKRVNKWLTSPEFGLSAYKIEDKQDIKNVITNHYLQAGSPVDITNWHIFKSNYYHFNDSDSYKEGVDNSDYICCFLKGEWVTQLKAII